MQQLKPIKNVFNPHTDRVREICKLGEGQEVYKSGRSTGFTEGRWSYLQSEVRLPNNPDDTSEVVFIATRNLGSIFAVHGDSGAWVLNEKGHLGGMIIGGNPQMDWTYVTPISVVFADIEVRLDCKVRLLMDE